MKYETEYALESDIIKYATICSDSYLVFPVVRVTVKEEKFSRHFHDPVIFTGPHPQSHPEILSWSVLPSRKKRRQLPVLKFRRKVHLIRKKIAS